MSVNIAVEGCCHGALDTIFADILQAEAQTGKKVDLLLICGDFECVRDLVDLESMAVPHKYRQMKTFYKYFTGECIAPVKTVFIGGNHEASNVLQSLFYGGYVAPNIYFMGFAGVINFKGLRIGGLSGIYNDKHYHHGHYEKIPYSDGAIRSIYHLRELEVYRMMHLQHSATHLDAFLTHDWPNYVWEHGDVAALLRIKPFFREDIDKGALGSPPGRQILDALMPSFWFSGHLHVKFEAVVPHAAATTSSTADASEAVEAAPAEAIKTTRFLALDKVIPGRPYLQFLQIPLTGSSTIYDDNELHYDPEWLSIVVRTHQELRKSHFKYPTPPKPCSAETITATETKLKSTYGDLMVIPDIPTIPELCQPCLPNDVHGMRLQEGNVQTDRLLNCFELPHIWTVPYVPPTVGAATARDAMDIFDFEEAPAVDIVDPNAIDI